MIYKAPTSIKNQGAYAYVHGQYSAFKCILYSGPGSDNPGSGGPGSGRPGSDMTPSHLLMSFLFTVFEYAFCHHGISCPFYIQQYLFFRQIIRHCSTVYDIKMMS